MYTLKFQVQAADAGRKVKYFLRSTMQLSYHQSSVLKATGGLKVNGESVHANHILQAGDVVTAELPEQGAQKQVMPEALPVCIVYEDDDLCIVDKPAPLACQSTPKQPSGTLENRMHHRYAHIENYVFRPVNRLDKGTSGLMAVAKHAHAYQLMQRQLHSEHFIREYTAIVEGELSGEGTINLPIAKVPDASVRRCIDRENGQHAITHYRCESFQNGRTQVRLRLETGRTHQIRVHLSAAGHPIAGDFLYGSELPELPGRFALHSCLICFVHPITGETIECTSPLPNELKGLLD